MPIKILGTRPRKPRRFLGAISPRYIGTTLREMPAVKNREEYLCHNALIYFDKMDHDFIMIQLFCEYLTKEPMERLTPDGQRYVDT